ncbi:hypothetical protein B0H10DRAFT_905642 [Mycena sp. CBHHK59/15]|nr:hypothetical protein B0H10DRAFT_905642 [Mycena sp. CBHHK59/15]
MACSLSSPSSRVGSHYCRNWSALRAIMNLLDQPRWMFFPLPHACARSPSPTLDMTKFSSALMPWEQITHYRGNFSVKYQLDIVESAVNLVECGLGFTDCDYAELRDRVVVLPRVRRLYVMQTDFLDHLTAPMLEELFLEYLGDTDQLLPFISRSSRHLTKLFLYGCHSPNAVVDALQHLPALKHLYVNLGHYSVNREELDDFFAAMHIHRRPDDLCLHLKSLAIRVWYNRFSDSNFMDMLESRCRVGAPTRLLSLRIFFPVESKLDEDQKLRLEKIQEEGLIAHVSVVGRTAECMREECP